MCVVTKISTRGGAKSEGGGIAWSISTLNTRERRVRIDCLGIIRSNVEHPETVPLSLPANQNRNDALRNDSVLILESVAIPVGERNSPGANQHPPRPLTEQVL